MLDSFARSCPIALVAFLLLSGCTTWRRTPDALLPDARDLVTQFDARERRQIWVDGQATIVHGIQVRGDTVRAVPVRNPPDCDSCALYWSRAAIDSVRVSQLAQGRTVLLALAVLAFLTYWGITHTT